MYNPLAKMPVSFLTEKERREWMIANAQYFTLVRRSKRSIFREEFASLQGAVARGLYIIEGHPDWVLLIYAVYGPYDTWVTNVHKGYSPHKAA